MGIFTRKRQPDPPPPVFHLPYVDPINRANELLQDLKWIGGVPVRSVEKIPVPTSHWNVIWSDAPLYVGNSPRARWGRFRSRLRGYRARLGDALAVLRGDMEARDWGDE